MQLSNIARDVGEDAARGRLYLPRDWMREAGIDPDAWLANPIWNPRLGQLVDRLLDAADRLYARADIGIAGLPARCRPGIGAARRLYAEIGQEVRRRGLDCVSQRAVVSPTRKLSLLPPILAYALGAPASGQGPAPLEETLFLVDAVRHHPAPPETRPALSGFADRLIWVLDLFERLERRDRSRRGQTLPGETGLSPTLQGFSSHALSLD